MQVWIRQDIRFIILCSTKEIATMDPRRCSTSDHQYKTRVKFYKTSWKPPPIAWLKQNADASRITARQSTTINYVCRDDKWRFLHRTSRMIRDVLVLIAEVIAIRESLRVLTHVNMDNLFMENNSQTVIISTLNRITRRVRL